jgi:hypothetical protein
MNPLLSMSTPILSQIFGSQNIITDATEHNNANHQSVSLLVVSIVYHILTGSKNSIVLASSDTPFTIFVQNVLSQTNSSSSIILLSLFYMRKLSTRVSLKGEPGSEKRIWLTALILSDAFLNDNAFAMNSWSKVSDLQASEIVAMRREFLTGLRFDLVPPHDDYLYWLVSVEQHGAASYAYFMPLLTAQSPVLTSTYPLTPPLSYYSQLQYTHMQKNSNTTTNNGGAQIRNTIIPHNSNTQSRNPNIYT